MAVGITRWRGWGAMLIALVIAIVMAIWVVGTASTDGSVSGGDLPPRTDRGPSLEEYPPPAPPPPWQPTAPERSYPRPPAYDQDTAAPVDAWPDGEGDDTGDIPPLGFLSGDVTDTRGNQVSQVEVLARSADDTQRFLSGTGEYAIAVLPGRYEVLAVRWDGALPTRGFPQTVVIQAGDQRVVDLEVPAERTGGIGVFIREHPDGILVDGVVEGTPAWQAGLQSGDVIVEVDGTPAAILNLFDFQSIMTGPEGTEIEFVLSYETETGFEEETLVLERDFLERPEG